MKINVYIKILIQNYFLWKGGGGLEIKNEQYRRHVSVFL